MYLSNSQSGNLLFANSSGSNILADIIFLSMIIFLISGMIILIIHSIKER
jgi:hypothetical protein